MRRLAPVLAAAAVCAFAGASQAQTVLKASHQFPGGKGDARDEMVQIIAREAKAANVANCMSSRPVIMSVIDCAELLYGTWVILIPAMLANSAVAR